MPRARTSLDGSWRFWPDLDRALSPNPDDDVYVDGRERTLALGEPRSIRVPGAWQAQFDDLRLSPGVAFYERDFSVPAGWRGRAVRVHFGAVDYLCSVWCNGVHAGAHEGGYLPFEIDVTRHVRFGAPNNLTVRVLDPGPDRATQDAWPFEEIPHGKQSWYGPLGGIWQSVYIESSQEPSIARVHVIGDVAARRATMRLRLRTPALGGERVHYIVSPPDCKTTCEVSGAPLEEGESEQEVGVDVGAPELWEIASPHLYRVEARVLGPKNDVVDSWRDSFGFRTIETAGGAILLNGAPLYIRGALDQDYYLDSICTPPSDDVVREQMLRARELGLNLLRCHIKVPDPRYLYWADRLGLLVWAELPNSGKLTEGSKRRARATIAGMVERDFNHPSIIIWTVTNESWGVDLVGRADHRSWVAETYRWVKSLDETRLVVDNSACEPNFHVSTDLNDFHFYSAIPDQRDEWVDLIEDWVGDPARTFSPHGDAERAGDEPMIVSEFGNWGLPDPALLTDDEGREPWWFDTGDKDVVRPRGVRERFSAWGLESVFGSWTDFVRCSQDHQFEALKLSIEDMRRHPELSGYVITELTDCHWECNGLLDMSRAPKSFHDSFRNVNGPDAILPFPERARYVAGDRAHLRVLLSHFSDADLERCTVAWRVDELGARGALESAAAAASVTDLGEVDFAIPPLPAARRVTVHLSLVDRRGADVAHNSVELLLFPSGSLPTAPGVMVADRWDTALERHLADGGRAVVLASSPEALPPDASVTLVAREGTRFKGEWAQGMHWLRPALTGGLPLLPRVDVTWAGLTPDHVLRGYRPADRAEVLSGMYLGWVHSSVATIAAFRHASGAGILCTFPFGDGDPLAATLLARLTNTAGAPDFEPARFLVP